MFSVGDDIVSCSIESNVSVSQRMHSDKKSLTNKRKLNFF